LHSKMKKKSSINKKPSKLIKQSKDICKNK
jgi:hypothetical protein